MRKCKTPLHGLELQYRLFTFVQYELMMIEVSKTPFIDELKWETKQEGPSPVCEAARFGWG